MKYVLLCLFTAMVLIGATCQPPPTEYDAVTIVWDDPNDSRLDHYEVYVGSESGNYNTTVNTNKDTFYTHIIKRGDSAFFMAKYHRIDGLASEPSNELKWPMTTTESPDATVKYPFYTGVTEAENLQLVGYERWDLGNKRVVRIVPNTEGYVRGTFVGEDGDYTISVNVFFDADNEDVFKLFVKDTHIKTFRVKVGNWQNINFGIVSLKKGDQITIHGTNTTETQALIDFVTIGFVAKFN